MSDEENFIARWSRRKREAEQAAGEKPGVDASPDVSTPSDVQSAEPAAASADAAQAAKTQADAPPVDLDSLPPIESITAGSDIRAFLAPGIPAHLTRAALRRVWVADPAIRDFVGLAENAWDFNAPGGVPGFGPALPLEEAQRLVAEMLRDDTPAPPESTSGLHEPSQMPDVSAPSHNPPEPAATTIAPAAQPVASTPPDSAPSDAAAQDEAPQDRLTTVARQHGGALPR